VDNDPINHNDVIGLKKQWLHPDLYQCAFSCGKIAGISLCIKSEWCWYEPGEDGTMKDGSWGAEYSDPGFYFWPDGGGFDFIGAFSCDRFQRLKCMAEGGA